MNKSRQILSILEIKVKDTPEGIADFVFVKYVMSTTNILIALSDEFSYLDISLDMDHEDFIQELEDLDSDELESIRSFLDSRK